MDNNNFLLLDKIKSSIRNLKNIQRYAICATLLIIYSVFTNDFKAYLLVNNIITESIITAFIYVNIIRTKFVNKTFMKKFEILYLVLISIILINIIEIMLLFVNIPRSYFLFLYSIQATLEYCAIGSAFKFRNSNLNSLIICIGYTILFTVLFINLNGDYRLFSDQKGQFFIGSIVASVIVSIGVCIATLENMLMNRKKFSIDEFKQIIFYMSLIMANYLGLITLIMNYNRIYEFIIIIKCIALYKFYNYLISKVLDNSLIEINNNIEVAIKTKRELNTILKKRNTILNEANTMIKKSRDRNNELIDSIYGGVFLFYLDKLQYINKRTLGTLNITNDEILGIEINDFIKRYFDITLKDIQKSQNYIPCAKMKYTNFEVEIFLACIDKNSKILYIHDISEINENIKIMEVLEEYLQEDEIKNEFFSNISHELKTPVNLIFSALQVNAIYLKENNIEGFNKNRKIIKQNCLRLIRTINNFIDANKISEGYMIPDCKIHNIVNLVEGISLSSNKYIKLIKNTLTFDAEEEEIYINCDKEMITRIILNILSNSVKYGKEGGNINVSVGIYMDDYVVIKVKNDGLKIDKETIPYVFDKFTKLNKTFNRLKEGSGLGLFLTKALIELQGGNIRIVSNNSGNEFIITMPRVKQSYNSQIIHDDFETNLLEEKIDVEFSDIYIE